MTLTAPSTDALISGLDDTQRAAVTEPHTPLAILAGAGSGKTRVLTRRIAWQAAQRNLDARHVVAVTFTRKAAGQLGDRLRTLGVHEQVTAGTFHALALAQLRRRATDAGRDMPELLDRKARILGPMSGAKGADAAVAAMELASEIEWAKARLVRPEGYEAAVARAQRDTPRPPGEVAAIYERYEQEKRRRRLIDFDDLIWWCADALETDEEFANVQRWRFRHLFVDEFQDATRAQFRLLLGWLGDRTDLCVVGDAEQAIYGFTGADAGYLTRFTRHFPTAHVVRLGVNYRSSEEVVRVAAAILPEPSRALELPRTPRGSGPEPTVRAYPSDDDEAAGVARMLVDGHGPDRRWSSMAVLYRINAQSAAFEEAFRKAGIPVRVRGAGRFLDRPEVKAALGELRKTSQAAPSRSFGEHLADLAADAAEASEERREHVEALLRLGREYLAADGGSGTLDGFLAFLNASLRSEQADVAGDAVELLTFHRAKGLEFDTVFVTGLERGLVPISYAETPAQLAEERRLLHVALSRAARHLHLSWAQERAIGLRTVKRTPSAYLAPIEAAASGQPVPVTAASSPADARAALAQARDKRSKTKDDGGNPVLFAALVDWRRGLARAASVPAYVIFPDKTLAAIVRNQPKSRTELLQLDGIGPVKLERYGDAVLEVVAQNVG